ncbi:hypothetical protein ACFQ1I_18615 [Kitasatospora arboriphila]
MIHQMRPTARLADGADEWSCPTCGRRIVLRRPPDPGITVLDAGDESAVHIGITEPTAAERAAAEAAERYGLGPVQEIPRPLARGPRDAREAEQGAAGREQPSTPGTAPGWPRSASTGRAARPPEPVGGGGGNSRRRGFVQPHVVES